MSLTEPRRQSQDLILTCGEPQQRAAQEHTVRAFTPSAMSTTTFTDANVDATAVGLYVRPEDGDARGQDRQIISVSGTTATVDASWSSVANVTRIRAWAPPDIPVRVTTADASSPYDVISSLHANIANEPDDYWLGSGYQLLGRGGANAGSARTFTDFTSTTGAFADGAPAATSVGDFFDLRKLIRPAADVEATLTHKTIQRGMIGMGQHDADVPIPITNDGTLNVSLVLRPLGTAAASGVVAVPPTEMSDILADIFTVTKDTGGTVADASTPGEIDCSTSSFTQGGFALFATGEAAQIYTVGSTTNITAYGTGQATQASLGVGSVVHAAAWYQRKTQGFLTRTWDLYRGGKLRQLFHGCLPSLNMTISREQLVTFALNYISPEALEYNVNRPVAIGATNPLSVGDFGIPTDGKGARCMLDGTKIVVSELSVNWGFTPKPRGSLSGINQGDGCLMDTGPITGSMSVYADNDDISGFRALVDRLPARTYMQFLYQKGSAPKDTFVFGVPAMYFTSNTFSYNDRQGMFTCEFTCVNPEAAGYGSSYINMPAAAFGLL